MSCHIYIYCTVFNLLNTKYKSNNYIYVIINYDIELCATTKQFILLFYKNISDIINKQVISC